MTEDATDELAVMCNGCGMEATYQCTNCGCVVCPICADFHCDSGIIPIEDGED